MSADSRTLRQHAVPTSELPQQIFDQIIGDLFDQPVISNLYRPHYVERMIALALGEGFELVSADWAGWDIESSEGVRIEVKQSAAWQTWSDATSEPKPSSAVFDISARTGHWTAGGAKWVPKAGRQAHLYIFAWHPITKPDEVDHRDPGQWLFYIVPMTELPAGQKTISQSVIAQRWRERRFSEIQDAVLELISELASASERKG
jgi:hypothetical protein